MNKKDQGRNLNEWNGKSWLYVLMCIIAIYVTIPLARSMQIYVYDTLGKEFFTYLVLIIIGSGLATLFYVFIFRLKIRTTSQYIWLIICSGLCVSLTLHLREHPEEAVHLLEYGLLSIFVFHALSFKIRDWTIYVTAGLLVLLTGVSDEFIQWLVPGRHWGYKDVGINGLAGAFILLAVARGVRPRIISTSVRKSSINLLFRVITVNVVVLALCLSNTPERVRRYSTSIPFLSWLQSEETMTEYGYKHTDSNAGTFLSRFSMDQLKEIDREQGRTFGAYLQEHRDTLSNQLLKTYSPGTHPFLYEFLVHIFRRNAHLEMFNTLPEGEEKDEAAFIALRENQLVETFFHNTLEHSSLSWSGDMQRVLQRAHPPEDDGYISKAGTLIILFGQWTAWLGITVILIAAWILCEHWKKRVSDSG